MALMKSARLTEGAPVVVSADGVWSALVDRVAGLLEAAEDGWRVATTGLDEPEPRPLLVVEIDRDALHLADWADPRRPRVIATHALGETEVVATLARAEAMARGIGRDRIGVGIRDSMALDTVLRLPKAPRASIARAVALHSATEQPYPAGLVLWRVTYERSPSVVARLAFVPSVAVLPVVAALAAVGIAPAIAVRCAGESSFAMRPSWLADDGSGAATRVQPRAARLAVFCAAGVLVSLAANFAMTAVTIARLEPEAQVAGEELGRSERVLTDARFLAARQREALGRLDVIETLAAQLPDGTWLERLEIKEGKIEIAGSAASAADTLRVVGDVAALRGAEFLAAVTRDSARGIERFRIGAQIAVAPGSGRSP